MGRKVHSDPCFLFWTLADFDEEGMRPSATIGPVDTHAFRESRLPIIDMNGDVTWYLDFAPPTGGTTGQVIRLDPECGEFVVCAPDFATFLAMYREDLEAGRIRKTGVRVHFFAHGQESPL